MLIGRYYLDDNNNTKKNYGCLSKTVVFLPLFMVKVERTLMTDCRNKSYFFNSDSVEPLC